MAHHMNDKSDISSAQSEIQKSPGRSDGQIEMTERRASDVLSSDVEIKGTISCRRELRIDGRVEGEINSDGMLTIGDNAEIRGDIKGKSITVFGKVYGNITAIERCELKAHAGLQGDLKTSLAVVEEGAIFVGKSFVESWDAAQILERIAEAKSYKRTSQPRELAT
jgi:cytoskeletal protein CcmA (bactofilin family)